MNATTTSYEWARRTVLAATLYAVAVVTHYHVQKMYYTYCSPNLVVLFLMNDSRMCRGMRRVLDTLESTVTRSSR